MKILLLNYYKKICASKRSVLMLGLICTLFIYSDFVNYQNFAILIKNLLQHNNVINISWISFGFIFVISHIFSLNLVISGPKQKLFKISKETIFWTMVGQIMLFSLAFTHLIIILLLKINVYYFLLVILFISWNSFLVAVFYINEELKWYTIAIIIVVSLLAFKLDANICYLILNIMWISGYIFKNQLKKYKIKHINFSPKQIQVKSKTYYELKQMYAQTKSLWLLINFAILSLLMALSQNVHFKIFENLQIILVPFSLIIFVMWNFKTFNYEYKKTYFINNFAPYVYVKFNIYNILLYLIITLCLLLVNKTYLQSVISWNIFIILVILFKVIFQNITKVMQVLIIFLAITIFNWYNALNYGNEIKMLILDITLILIVIFDISKIKLSLIKWDKRKKLHSEK